MNSHQMAMQDIKNKQLMSTKIHYTPTNIIFTKKQLKKRSVMLSNRGDITDSERAYESRKKRCSRFKRRMLDRCYRYLFTLTFKNRSFDFAESVLKLVKDKLYSEKNAFVIITEPHNDGIPHYHIIMSQKPSFIDKKGYFRGRLGDYSSYFFLKGGINFGRFLPRYLTTDYYFMCQYLAKYLTKYDTYPKYSNRLTPSENVFTYINPDMFPHFYFLPYSEVENMSIIKQKLINFKLVSNSLIFKTYQDDLFGGTRCVD